jgi:hypothetical protein
VFSRLARARRGRLRSLGANGLFRLGCVNFAHSPGMIFCFWRRCWAILADTEADFGRGNGRENAQPPPPSLWRARKDANKRNRVRLRVSPADLPCPPSCPPKAGTEAKTNKMKRPELMRTEWVVASSRPADKRKSKPFSWLAAPLLHVHYFLKCNRVQ